MRTVVGVGLFVWRALYTVSPLDMRAEASRADAIVYGSVQDDGGRRQVIVEEIWKSATGETELRVGSVIPVPQLPRDAHPERLVVFLKRSSRDDRLHAGAMVAVNHGRLRRPDVSIEEAKAMCTGTQASNQAMQRTAGRSAFHFGVPSKFSARPRVLSPGVAGLVSRFD